MQIIVLGMHRSGTSAVARLLNMMGAYFAPENVTLPPRPDNPKGFWERKDIRELNDLVISSLSMSWDNISDFESSLLENEEVQQTFIPAARKIILNLDANRPWMVKDPRFCLLLPLWRPLLEIPICVYIYRNPIQVAQSLQTRDNFPMTLGLALWEKYNLQALENSANLPKVFVSHQDLMVDPVATVIKLYQDLSDYGVKGLYLPSDREITAFIDPKLFHEQGDTRLQSSYVNRQQEWLFEALQDGSLLDVAPPYLLSGSAAEILTEYKNKLLTAQHGRYQQREIEKREEEIAQRNREIARRDEEIIQRNQEIVRRDEEIAQRNHEIDQRNHEITKLDEEIINLHEQIENNQQVLKIKEAEIQSHKKHLTTYRNQWAAAENQVVALKQEIEQAVQQQHSLQTQLNSLQNTLTDKEHLLTAQAQQFTVLNTRLDRQNQNIGQLLHWLSALNIDITAVFNSLTWRSGNVLTQIALKLLFRKAGMTARDHINKMMADIAAWRKDYTASPSVSPIAPNPSAETLPVPVAAKMSAQQDTRDYARWIKNYDTLTPKAIKRMQQRISEWTYQPLISIVMPTYNTEEKWLRAAIESVQKQVYPNWELCIADDASTKPHVRRVLEDCAKRDQRIKLAFRTENGHISAASNTALELVTGEFVTFLDHDDLLALHALFWVVQDIIDYPKTKLWYSDEDKIDESGKRYDPYFKSDWNADLFLSHNLVTHLAVYRTEVIKKIGGLREGYEGAQDYDLVLRVLDEINCFEIRHIPRILYHWRAITGSTASRPEEKPYAILAAQRAIEEYLERRGLEARVTESPLVQGTIRVQYLLPSNPPLVSLIIPTYNGLSLLRMCVESIVKKTDYPNYEILIIDNASDDPATLAYMEQLEHNGQARIVDYPHPFNYADMNNQAVEHARGEFIGLLNNDIEVITPEWLTEMMGHAIRPEVGAVGARLWYPNDTLQHGGVVLGIGGVAGHSHKGLPRGHVGYFGRAALIQNFSAVTGACMVMRKIHFTNVGGLNAEHLTTAFNDVDLCLKMVEAGQRIVWTPYAELYHHESASRGYEDTVEKAARFEKEHAYMRKRWTNFLLADPAYSPNLTLDTQDFAYAWPPRVLLLS